MKTESLLLSLAFAVVFAYALSGASLTHKPDVMDYYVENSLPEIGSPNVVNSIVWDFRGYDTLGEETVLYTAVIGVFLIVHKKPDFKIDSLKKSIKKTME